MRRRYPVMARRDQRIRRAEARVRPSDFLLLSAARRKRCQFGAAGDVGASGQVIALVGTAGIGKSRVAHEFVGDLRRRVGRSSRPTAIPWSRLFPSRCSRSCCRACWPPAVSRLARRPLFLEEPPLHADLWPAALDAVLDRPVTDPRWGELEPLLRRRVVCDAVLDAVDKVVGRRRASCCWKICTGPTDRARPRSKRFCRSPSTARP